MTTLTIINSKINNKYINKTYNTSIKKITLFFYKFVKKSY